jgi:hypothetical protein
MQAIRAIATPRNRAGAETRKGCEMSNASLKVSDLAKYWLKDPELKAEYDALEDEFTLAAALIRARRHAR